MGFAVTTDRVINWEKNKSNSKLDMFTLLSTCSIVNVNEGIYGAKKH